MDNTNKISHHFLSLNGTLVKEHKKKFSNQGELKSALRGLSVQARALLDIYLSYNFAYNGDFHLSQTYLGEKLAKNLGRDTPYTTRTIQRYNKVLNESGFISTRTTVTKVNDRLFGKILVKTHVSKYFYYNVIKKNSFGFKRNIDLGKSKVLVEKYNTHYPKDDHSFKINELYGSSSQGRVAQNKRNSPLVFFKKLVCKDKEKLYITNKYKEGVESVSSSNLKKCTVNKVRGKYVAKCKDKFSSSSCEGDIFLNTGKYGRFYGCSKNKDGCTRKATEFDPIKALDDTHGCGKCYGPAYLIETRRNWVRRCASGCGYLDEIGGRFQGYCDCGGKIFSDLSPAIYRGSWRCSLRNANCTKRSSSYAYNNKKYKKKRLAPSYWDPVAKGSSMRYNDKNEVLTVQVYDRMDKPKKEIKNERFIIDCETEMDKPKDEPGQLKDEPGQLNIFRGPHVRELPYMAGRVPYNFFGLDEDIPEYNENNSGY